MIGLAPVPNAPTTQGPFAFIPVFGLAPEVQQEAVNVCPRCRRTRTPGAKLPLIVTQFDACVRWAPEGQPVKSPLVEKQIVFEPANATSGSCTVIWRVVAAVLEPSVAFTVTV